jgi:hypothetical protein
MHKRGNLTSLLDGPESALDDALAVGTEWFGSEHVLLKCLKLGVAVHHGALPTPYRKEIERLLREGTLKVTISSPTLAQGLNLGATSLLFHGLVRNREVINISEFRNVIGRAGRAFVDIEGLVLYPMFDNHGTRREQWEALIDSKAGREMESGLVRLLVTLLIRMQKKLQTNDLGKLMEYVAGQGAWDFPEVVGESEDAKNTARAEWRSYMTSLDTAVLSLLGEQIVPDDEIETCLDELLESSLFKRRLARRKEASAACIAGAMLARTKFIWAQSTPTQRRGYFLAGVGLDTGQVLDARAPELEALLLKANYSVGVGEHAEAVEAILQFAAIVFAIPPFVPAKPLENWRELLRAWLAGRPLAEFVGEDADAAINFVEQAFAYNLPWAMEAVRVRYSAHENPFSDETLELGLSDYPYNYAVSAVETGTLSIQAALLIQAGFASRLGAIEAVKHADARFEDMGGVSSWLTSSQVQGLTENLDWPTTESNALWKAFVESFARKTERRWEPLSGELPVKWHGVPPAPGTALRLGAAGTHPNEVFAADYTSLGTVSWHANVSRRGLLQLTATGSTTRLMMSYVGPRDFM